MEENKYQRGKIYKIVDNGYNMTYYGSTINKLCQRMALHRNKYKEFKNDTYHKYSVFDIFYKYGIENCKIELVENYPCNNKNELELREGYYIKNNDCVNKKIAGRTIKEWRQDNKKDIREKKEQYYENNKDILKEKRKENKDKINERRRELRKLKKHHHKI